MALTYFKRAGLPTAEYTRINLFTALYVHQPYHHLWLIPWLTKTPRFHPVSPPRYLASDMEEDEEEHKYEIFPWALGPGWRRHFPRFLRRRDRLWARMSYRAAVSRHCCEEVSAVPKSPRLAPKKSPNHHHSGGSIEERRGPAASLLGCGGAGHAAFCLKTLLFGIRLVLKGCAQSMLLLKPVFFETYL